MSPEPRFRFSLDTVLKVRLLREDQIRQDLARARQLLERSRQALTDTEQRRETLLAELAGSPGRNWDPEEFHRYQLHLDSLHTAVAGWQENIARQQHEIDQQRQALLEAHRERRLLENLRQKKASAYRREIARLMERESEAITLGRWAVAARRDYETL